MLCLMFADKLGNLVQGGGDHRTSADNVVTLIPIICDNGTENDVLAALNNLNIRLAGTTSQLYSMSTIIVQ